MRLHAHINTTGRWIRDEFRGCRRHYSDIRAVFDLRVRWHIADDAHHRHHPRQCDERC